MNMISTGSFTERMDASTKENSVVSQLVKAWEKKNSKVARAGGMSLMALSLAACGSDDATTTTSTSTSTTTTTTTTPTVTALNTALTVGVDSVTGTTANDTISGARIDTVQTWTSADVVAGGTGTDSLTATIAASVAPASGAVTGVENLTVTGIGAVTVDFSSATASFITGATHLTNIGSNNTMAFNDITGIAEMTVNNSASGTTFSYNDTVLAGTADSVTLNLIGATAAVTIGTNTDADGDYESMVVNATGAASDMVAGGGIGNDLTTMDVNAAVAMDFGTTAEFPKITSWDASDSTGGVTAVFANKATTASAATAVSIKGGAGNDNYDISALTAANHGALTVDMGAGNDTVTLGARGATDFTIAAGDGTDTLSVSIVPAAASHSAISGFETVTFTNAIANNATASIDLIQFSGNTTFSRINLAATVASDDGTDETIAITAARDAVTTIGMGVLDTNDIDVSFARLVDGTANSLTFKATAATLVEDLTASDEETLTFDSADGAFNYATLTAADMTALTLVGDNTVDLGALTAAKLVTVDATGLAATANGDFIANMSTATGAMTVTSNAATTHTGVLNITTGSGADTITGTNNGDTINGGDGADIINGGVGADIISGGNGNDTITAGAGTDAISGGIGVDTIDLTQATAAVQTVIFGNQSTVTGGTDIAVTALGGADKITGFNAGTVDDSLIFDLSGMVLAGSTEYVGAIGSLAQNSGEEIVVLTGVGYATDEACEDAVAARVTTDSHEMVIIYFNTTSSKTHVIRESDAGAADTASTILIATLEDFTSQTLHDTLDTSNIGSFA
jgi:hypothetical protein